MNKNLIIRPSVPEDLPALTEIYNYEVVNGTSTLDLHPKSLEERRQWLEAHNRDNHPLLTALADGTPVGYASLSPFREKEAYATTVELSIYVAPDCRGQGIATALMRTILDMARSDDNTRLVASVITSGNGASRRLHEKFGFVFCGTMHGVGKKFGEFLDIDYYELPV